MKKFAIVTDFDGTITTLDIGNSMAVHLGSTTEKQIEEDYKNNLDAKAWMAYHFSRVKLNREEFESLVLSYAVVKPWFGELARYCAQNKIPLEIASGGLDIYINPVLQKYNLKDIPVYSVRGVFKETSGIAVDFPHFGNLTLGQFKALRVKYYKDKGYKVIFMGDGISDFEAARAADIVFATAHLEALCKSNNVEYREFKDFKNALRIVKNAPLS
jgi:2-hydroxy-3-keto-5-methylthiopentenyl-1-phosphate phosphatase